MTAGVLKAKKELIKVIIAFLDISQDYYSMDGKCFPSGVNINDVQTYLISLKFKCPYLEDQKIFDMFIGVINGKRFDFIEFFNTENASIDPKILTTTGRQEKNSEKKVLENGDYDVGLNIGKN